MRDGALVVQATNGVAVVGLGAWAWWPVLQQISGVAALIVPIMSLIWLAIQIKRAVWPGRG